MRQLYAQSAWETPLSAVSHSTRWDSFILIESTKNIYLFSILHQLFLIELDSTKKIYFSSRLMRQLHPDWEHKEQLFLLSQLFLIQPDEAASCSVCPRETSVSCFSFSQMIQLYPDWKHKEHIFLLHQLFLIQPDSTKNIYFSSSLMRQLHHDWEHKEQLFLLSQLFLIQPDEAASCLFCLRVYKYLKNKYLKIRNMTTVSILIESTKKSYFS